MSISITGQVSFPPPTNSIINMMPIIMGDRGTIPKHLQPYSALIDRCDLTPGDVVYLTVHESVVSSGSTQRRVGIHTDGTSAGPWGGGHWGRDGIWLASTDGDCLVWDEEVGAEHVDNHGALTTNPKTDPINLAPRTLYRITDRTPHAALPAARTHYRQFFRLVGPDIFAWYAQHSTPSPVGVKPRCRVITTSKFGQA